MSSKIRTIAVGLIMVFVLIKPFTTVLEANGPNDLERKIEKLSLSIPNLKLDEGEIILEFEATVLGGFVVSIRGLDRGWSVSVTNRPQWKTVVTGWANTDSAAVKTSIDDVLVVGKVEGTGLEIHVEIKTERLYRGTPSVDMKKYVFEMSDLKFTKID